MQKKQKVYVAAVLHPNNVLEWLYTFTKEEDAQRCVDDYCQAMNQSEGDGYTFMAIEQDVNEEYCPLRHIIGVMVQKEKSKAESNDASVLYVRPAAPLDDPADGAR